MTQDFAGSDQNRVTAKTKFEPGRVTAQHIVLLLPSLIDNIYFVICTVEAFPLMASSCLQLWRNGAYHYGPYRISLPDDEGETIVVGCHSGTSSLVKSKDCRQ